MKIKNSVWRWVRATVYAVWIIGDASARLLV